MDERAAEGASAGLQWAGFRQALTPTVLVATLGYFVDIYDLLLFRVVREPSLLALGVPDSQTLSVGLTLDNFQQAGLLIGGILWGSLGDKRGRVSVLYGSILLYSTANVLNAFISTIHRKTVIASGATNFRVSSLGTMLRACWSTMSTNISTKACNRPGTPAVARRAANHINKIAMNPVTNAQKMES